MVRSAVVSVLVLVSLSGCAMRTRAKVAMVIGAAATVTGSILVADVMAHPTDCSDAMGPPAGGPLDGVISAAGCAGYDAARAMPGAMLATFGVTSLLTGIIAYALAPSEPRQARQAPHEKLRGERWTRLRDAANRGRSGR